MLLIASRSIRRRSVRNGKERDPIQSRYQLASRRWAECRARVSVEQKYCTVVTQKPNKSCSPLFGAGLGRLARQKWKRSRQAHELTFRAVQCAGRATRNEKMSLHYREKHFLSSTLLFLVLGLSTATTTRLCLFGT